jgi:hypothetical protein
MENERERKEGRNLVVVVVCNKLILFIANDFKNLCFYAAAKDSAHVEIMRIGTYRKDWGGVPLEEILSVMQSGEILVPQIEVLPTAVVANPDTPPELEIRFDMEPELPNFDDLDAPLPINWQLRFLHNQFFKKFIFPSRFCPGAFHSTILRKAEFRSEEVRRRLALCVVTIYCYVFSSVFVRVCQQKNVLNCNTNNVLIRFSFV